MLAANPVRGRPAGPRWDLGVIRPQGPRHGGATTTDVPDTYETDLTCLTSVRVLAPTWAADFDPSLVDATPLLTMRLYNWKYVT